MSLTKLKVYRFTMDLPSGLWIFDSQNFAKALVVLEIESNHRTSAYFYECFNFKFWFQCFHVYLALVGGK